MSAFNDLTKPSIIVLTNKERKFTFKQTIAQRFVIFNVSFPFFKFYLERKRIECFQLEKLYEITISNCHRSKTTKEKESVIYTQYILAFSFDASFACISLYGTKLKRKKEWAKKHKPNWIYS